MNRRNILKTIAAIPLLNIADILKERRKIKWGILVEEDTDLVKILQGHSASVCYIGRYVHEDGKNYITFETTDTPEGRKEEKWIQGNMKKLGIPKSQWYDRIHLSDADSKSINPRK